MIEAAFAAFRGPKPLLGAFVAYLVVILAGLTPAVYLNENEAANNLESWAFGWSSFALMMVITLVSLIFYRARNNENKLRRCCV